MMLRIVMLWISGLKGVMVWKMQLCIVCTLHRQERKDRHDKNDKNR